jgi:muramoyltetrapeptide carboxypeptidase
VGRHALSRWRYLAGTDEERRGDLVRALTDPTIDAVWALRGGYGTMRLIDDIDLTPLVRQPRAVVGFSDNTTLHLALDRLGLVSFHGPHAGGAFPAATERAFRRVLFEAAPPGELETDPSDPPAPLRGGVAEGELVGGNLALLAALAGTRFALRGRDRLIAIEDVGEPWYRIDRAFTQLLLAGCLDGAAGIIFGRFDACGENGDDVRLEDVLSERAGSLGVPVLANLPFGHVDLNACLPFGTRARLDADAGTLTFVEPAVE